MPRFTLNIYFQHFFCLLLLLLDKYGQAIVDRMDLFALDCVKMCLPWKAWGFSWH